MSIDRFYQQLLIAPINHLCFAYMQTTASRQTKAQERSIDPIGHQKVSIYMMAKNLTLCLSHWNSYLADKRELWGVLGTRAEIMSSPNYKYRPLNQSAKIYRNCRFGLWTLMFERHSDNYRFLKAIENTHRMQAMDFSL